MTSTTVRDDGKTILDMTMPKMTGDETFRHLKLAAPEVKVLLTSGYDESEAPALRPLLLRSRSERH